MDKSEIMEMARQYAHNGQVTTVVYYDEDMGAFWYVSENAFDMMADNCQVEYSWIIAVIEP